MSSPVGDLAEARPLDPSRLKEIDQATAAYNSLLSAMRWFETYVPKSLVLRLMARGDETQTLEDRIVTVLFTDIAGFTPFRRKPAGPRGGKIFESPFRTYRQLRRGRERNDRQVHWRCGHGVLGRP